MHMQIRQFIQAKLAVFSNDSKLVYPDTYIDPAQQDKDPQIWRNVTSLGPSRPLNPETCPDVKLYIINETHPEADLRLTYDDETYFIRGPINDMEKNPPDRRFTIYGCGGLMAKILLVTLEDKHDICSLHATSLYNAADNHMFVFIGGAGAGKTILMLEGSLRRGYRVFTTEYTHFKVNDGETTFFKGSLFDNVRIGNLIHDFPESVDALGVKIPEVHNIWDTKIVVDFRPVQTETDIIVNPEVTLVFPKIEGERKTIDLNTMLFDKCLLNTFLNAGEIINRSRLYYGTIAIPSFDNLKRAGRRLQLVKDFFANTKIRKAKTLFAGIQNCWPF